MLLRTICKLFKTSPIPQQHRTYLVRSRADIYRVLLVKLGFTVLSVNRHYLVKSSKE